jgi:glutamate/tyrosine decarboxylase-like PLP-dependent enzyme
MEDKSMTDTLQQRMFRDMADKAIFRQAQKFAFDYADETPGRPVFPPAAALANLDHFDEPLPESTGDPAAIVRRLHEFGSPATVTTTGGRYFGFVNGGAIPASLAARWLADFWDQNTAFEVMSPVAARLEEVCQGWLRELFGLPQETVAGFVSGTSLAIFCGLAAGRYRLLQNQGWDVNRQGLNGAPPIRVVTGRQAHGAVVKALALLGLGTDNIEWVDVDDQGRIIAGQVPELDGRSLLTLQAGNVSSGSFDPFAELAGRAEAAGAWVHIDGAFGLWAAAAGKLRHLTQGMEQAHSWSVDGHKTLNTPYDNGIVLCRDREALVQALQASGSYLVFGEKRDGMLYTPDMSRRARVVELWATLKYLGRAGVDELVYGLHQRAVQFAAEMAAAGFEVLNDVVFNQALVACDDDELTRRTMALVQQSGECWAGGATWFDRPVIRLSVCSWATTDEDISRSVRAFVAARETARRETTLS